MMSCVSPQPCDNNGINRVFTRDVALRSTRNPNVEGDANAKDNPACAYDDDDGQDQDNVSVDEGNEPTHLDTLQKDWERFDVPQRTSQHWKKTANSHGFRTISAFRNYMQQQQQVMDQVTSCHDNLLADEAVRFAWQTWELQPVPHKKELASKHGFNTIAALEEYLRLHMRTTTTRTTRTRETEINNTSNNDDVDERANHEAAAAAGAAPAVASTAATATGTENSIIHPPTTKPRKKRKRRTRVIPRALTRKR